MESSELIALISEIDKLPDETNIIELIETTFNATDRICPHCSHTKSYKHGISGGLQRYRCRQCNKTYNALTGTPLAHLRFKSKWSDYLKIIPQSLSVRQTAIKLNVNRNTALRWRHHFLAIMANQVKE